MAIPQYFVKATTFIAPWRLQKGSVIETEMEPGPHLEPMNNEARAKMESFYLKEVDYIDDKGLPQKIKPNFNKRPVTLEERAAAQVRLVSLPQQPQNSALQSLAEAQLRPATEYTLPPPAVVLTAPPEAPLETDNGVAIKQAVLAPEKKV